MKKAFYVLALMGVGIFVSSCDNDDDSNDKKLNLSDAYGTYSGKMSIDVPLLSKSALESKEGEENEVVINAVMKNDTVFFDNFPVKDLIIPIVGEEEAEIIAKAIGDVDYAVGYKAALNAAQDSIYMTLDPKKLEVKYTLTAEEGEESEKGPETVIIATIASNIKASYYNKKAKLSLSIEDVVIRENESSSIEEGEYDPFNINFELIKK